MVISIYTRPTLGEVKIMRNCITLIFTVTSALFQSGRQDATQPFDLIPTGFRYSYPEMNVYFPPYTMMKTPRVTDCDGKINGVPVDPMVSTVQFSDGFRDGCTLILPDGLEIKTVTVAVISRYFNFQTQNETRFEYEFNLSEMPNGAEMEFDWMSSFYVNSTRETSGNVTFDTMFEMNSSKCLPYSALVDFEGVNLTAPSPDEASVEFHVEGTKHIDDRVTIKTKRGKYYLKSSVEIDKSIAQETSGTRGLLYISGAFRIRPYLVLKAGINAGREIYKLNGKYYLFPFGSFGMLQPISPVVTVYRNQWNIIPCKTIGASQYSFNYTPYLLKLSSPLNGTWIKPKFQAVRNILDLYIRESSAIISNTTENLDGTYACVLDYDRKSGNFRQRKIQTIRRMFKVVSRQSV